MSDDFERRLAESLRHGAAQVRPAPDPLVVVRTPRPPERRAPRRGLVAVAVGLLAVLVLATPVVLHARQQARPAVSPGAASQPTLAWRLSSGLYHDHGGVHPVGGSAVVVGPGGFAYLIVFVAPANPDGKTYLQAWQRGGWTVLGPHELDVHSRVSYLLWPPASATVVTYRVFVPGSGRYGEAYSSPVTVRIQR